MQQQVGSLVSGEAAGKTQCQGVGVEEMSGGFDILGRSSRGRQGPGQSLTSVLYERPAGGGPKSPQAVAGDAANLLFQILGGSQPALLAAAFCPKGVGFGGVPGGHVDSVGDVSDGDFVRGPARKQRQKEAPADAAV